MGLDLRLPIGLMFSLLGALLGAYGLATGSDTDLYRASLGDNINLIWGAVLLIFGALMFGFALRAKNHRRPEE